MMAPRLVELLDEMDTEGLTHDGRGELAEAMVDLQYRLDLCRRALRVIDEVDIYHEDYNADDAMEEVKDIADKALRQTYKEEEDAT